MTKEEFEAQYGSVELTFSSYYKYAFTFKGTAPDGTEIRATYGGRSDSIYRHEVANNEVRKVGSLDQDWHSCIAEKDGVEVFNFYDF